MLKRGFETGRLSLFLGLCFAVGSTAGALPAQEVRSIPYVPLIYSVSFPPMPIKGDGQYRLIYELHLTSFLGRDLTLRRVEAVSPAGVPIKAYQGEDLSRSLVRPGKPPDPEDNCVLGSGARAVVFIMLTFGNLSDIPDVLTHRVTVAYARGSGEQVILQGEGRQVPVLREEPLVIGPPVRSGVWLAGNGPGDGPVGHRLSMQAWNGRVVVNQRYALDFMKFNDDGRLVQGESSVNAHWPSYGEEALAVADGVVTEANDGIVENTPNEKYAVPNNLESAAGNYVVLRLGPGAYAAYAHLQPKSLRVKAGDKVKKGQVLGLIGNSGISDAPHLHFHMIEADSFYGGEGIPFVFERFESLGPFENLDENLDKRWIAPGPPVARVKEIPLRDVVIRFNR